MKKFIRRWLGIDELLGKLLRIEMAFVESQECNEDFSSNLDKILELNLVDTVEKLRDNTKRVNQMLLELKGVVSISRSLLKESTAKPPVKRKKQQLM